MTPMQELPPGFRFYPTEEELVSFYMHLLWLACFFAEYSGELCQGDTEQWFFFTPRQEREARGGRPNRTTASGYWKATGSPSYVYSSDNRVIGLRHEFSLCRVYIISGSFRAFDRRPIELTRDIQEQQGDQAGTSNQNAAMVERTPSSPETSCSGDLADNPMAGGSTDWEMNQHPLWEWEQFNWPK